MNEINNYLLLNILKYLTIDDISNLILVDKYKNRLLKEDNIWKILLDKYKIELHIEDIDMYKIVKKSTYRETLFLVKDLNQLKKINRLKNKTIIEIYNLQELYLNNNKIKEIPSQIGFLTNIQMLWLYFNKKKKIQSQKDSLTNLQQALAS